MKFSEFQAAAIKITKRTKKRLKIIGKAGNNVEFNPGLYLQLCRKNHKKKCLFYKYLKKISIFTKNVYQ